MGPNPSLDTTRSAHELAEIILAGSDRTKPLDPRSLGLLPLLEGTPDQRDLEKCARVYAYVRDGSSDSLVKLRCTVEILGVWRRNPEADVSEIIQQLKTAKVAVIAAGNLDQATASYLASLEYSRGIALRAPQNYLHAGHAQDYSAVWSLAAGEPPTKAMTAIFIRAVEHATQTLSDLEAGAEATREMLTHLRGLRVEITAACQVLGVSYPAWMASNAGIHIWFAHLMTEQDYQERDADEKAILERADKSPHWAACVRVAQLTRQEQYQDAMAEADRAVEALEGLKSSSTANALLALQLLKARCCQNLGYDDEARELYAKVANWAGQDGLAVVRAVESWEF